VFDGLNSSSSVDARYNWWGNESGPSGAGPGNGDSINNATLITFSPWLCNPSGQIPIEYCEEEPEEPEDPIAHWKFDEGSDDIAYDSSANDNDGTLENGPVWVDGISGSALEFDGVDDYVKIDSDSAFNLTDVVISVWINLDDNEKTNVIVDKIIGGNGYRFVVDSNSKLNFGIGFGTGTGSCEVDVVLEENTWYHVVGGYWDGGIKFYVNGDYHDGCGYGQTMTFNSDNLYIGSDNGDSGFFNGTIDEVAIWNRALSSTEISDLYYSYDFPVEEIVLPEEGFTFELAAEYDTDGNARDVVVIGDLAYIADNDEGFIILDISNLSNIDEMDRYKKSGFIYSSNIQIVGKYAFVAEGSEVNVYDISNPYDIVHAGNYDVDGALQSDIVIRGDYAFVAAGTEKGVVALDISDVSDITLLDYYNTNGNAYGLQIVGDLVYVADVDGIVILNVSNPSSIEFVGDYDTDGDAFNLAIDGNLAYVAVDGEGLVILDVSNPEDIVSVGLYEASRSAHVRVVGKYALFGMRENGVIALDITDPSNPEFVTSYDTNGDVYDLTVTNDYVYVADYDNGLVVLEIVPVEESEDPISPDSSSNDQ
jgi:hypothetical protein